MSVHIALTIDAALTPFWPRIRYVLDFLRQHPLNPGVELHDGIAPLSPPFRGKLHLHYGTAPLNPPFRGRLDGTGPIWFIPAQRCVFGGAPADAERMNANAYSFGAQRLYSVEMERKAPQPWLSQAGEGRFVFGFDWIETLFFHLSRWEEYHLSSANTDEHGNRHTDSLFSVRHDIHHIPVVDQLVFCLFEALGLRPKSRPTSWGLTHDLDYLRLFTTPWRAARGAMGALWREKRLSASYHALRNYVRCRFQGQKDPYDTFDWMFSDSAALEKIIYIPAGSPHSRFDPDEVINDPFLRDVYEQARAKGYDFGLHPSYTTWKNAQRFNDERRRLERWAGEPVVHTRQHFLHFQFPDTAQIIEQADLKTDATLGYRSRIGFRCGTGFAYHLYHFEKETSYTWLEKPLAVMDIALLREAAFDARELKSLWNRFVSANSMNTHINVLFHNSIFHEYPTLYETLADICKGVGHTENH